MGDPGDLQDRLRRLRRSREDRIPGLEETSERELRSREQLFRAREGVNRDRPQGRTRPT